MTKNLIVFVPLMQDSQAELWALQSAARYVRDGKKVLFFEADLSSSVAGGFEEAENNQNDIVSVIKRMCTLNQAIRRISSLPKLDVICGNTLCADVSGLNSSDMSVIMADLSCLMNDYECTVIKCRANDFSALIPCFNENTQVILQIIPVPECIEQAAKIINIAKKSPVIPFIKLKIVKTTYPSQDLRIFQQFKDMFNLPRFNYIKNDIGTEPMSKI